MVRMFNLEVHKESFMITIGMLIAAIASPMALAATLVIPYPC